MNHPFQAFLAHTLLCAPFPFQIIHKMHLFMHTRMKIKIFLFLFVHPVSAVISNFSIIGNPSHYNIFSIMYNNLSAVCIISTTPDEVNVGVQIFIVHMQQIKKDNQLFEKERESSFSMLSSLVSFLFLLTLHFSNTSTWLVDERLLRMMTT